MKRSTNRKILNFALLPLIGIITVYLAFPEMLKATDASNAFHPLVSYFWVLAILGGLHILGLGSGSSCSFTVCGSSSAGNKGRTSKTE